MSITPMSMSLGNFAYVVQELVLLFIFETFLTSSSCEQKDFLTNPFLICMDLANEGVHVLLHMFPETLLKPRCMNPFGWYPIAILMRELIPLDMNMHQRVTTEQNDERLTRTKN